MVAKPCPKRHEENLSTRMLAPKATRTTAQEK